MISDSDSNEVTSAHVDYTAKLPLDQKVYFQYYVQDDTDDGVLMNTKIKVKEVIWSAKLKVTSYLSLIILLQIPINRRKLTSQILQIEDPAHGYLVNRNRVKVHVEWLQSFLLFQSSYHHYDDLIRIQTYQMR